MNSTRNFDGIRTPFVPAGILVAPILFSGFLPIQLASPLINLFGLIFVSLTFFRFDRHFFRIVMPLLMVFLLGFIAAFSHLPKDIFRDISYALNPIVLLFIGYWLADSLKTWSLFVKILVFCGIIFSCQHLLQFAFNPMLLSYDLDAIRKEAGAGNSLEVLSCVLIIFHRACGPIRILPKYIPRWLAIVLLVTSILLSLSRTNFIVFIILILSFFGAMNRISFKRIILSLVVIFGVVTFFSFFQDQERGSFFNKLGGSLSEISISEKENINTDWRGFEAYMAVEQFMSSTTIQKVFGQGFGALVDIGFYMPLGDVNLRFIPILHNGYAYILTKVGLLGLLLYVVFYYRALRCGFRNSFSSSQLNKFYARLLVGCTWSQAAVMLVGGGMAQAVGTGPSFVILMGYLFHKIIDFNFQSQLTSEYVITNKLT